MADKLTFIHTSDWHLEHDSDDNYNRVRARLRMIKEYADEHIHNPWIVVGTGDLTDNARPEEYRKLKALLREFGIYYLLVPGNHDVTALGNLVFASGFNEAGCRSFYDSQMEMVAKISNELNCHVAVNSLAPFANTRLGKRMLILWLPKFKTKLMLLDSNEDSDINAFARGELGEDQLNLVKNHLSDEEEEGWTKVLMMHHHPVFNNYFQFLKESDRLLKLIWDVPSLLLLFGHKHKPNRWSTGAGGLMLSAHDLKTKQRTTSVDIITISDGNLDTTELELELE